MRTVLTIRLDPARYEVVKEPLRKPAAVAGCRQLCQAQGVPTSRLATAACMGTRIEGRCRAHVVAVAAGIAARTRQSRGRRCRCRKALALTPTTAATVARCPHQQLDTGLHRLRERVIRVRTDSRKPSTPATLPCAPRSPPAELSLPLSVCLSSLSLSLSLRVCV